MKKLSYILFITIFTLFGCHSATNLGSEKVLLLKNDILKGDTNSYEKLSSYYFDNSLDSLLPYSKIMADKFDYTRAYYDVFEIIYVYSGEGECVDYNLSCLDYESKKDALNYFKKAIKKGDESASGVLLNFYDKDKSYPIKELYENIELIKIAKSNLGL